MKPYSYFLVRKIISNLSKKNFWTGKCFSTAPVHIFKNESDVNVSLFGTIFERKWEDRICLTDFKGENVTFLELRNKSLQMAKDLKQLTDGKETRVAFLCPRDVTVLNTLWGIWLSNNVAVPLTSQYPDNMLEYILKHSESTLVVTTKEYADKMRKITAKVNSRLHVVDIDTISNSSAENWKYGHSTTQNAMILFTSGTTGLPKGVLISHQNLNAHIDNICQAWEMTSQDTMLNVLPLHHTHGLIHALLCPLAVGARCHLMEKFDPTEVWSELLSNKSPRPSVLTGVPTIYVKLIEEFENTYGRSYSQAEFVKATCKEKMRITLSGSASLPVPVLEQWESITGHRIVERYGMTETGVILTNPIHGKRKPGFVGVPFPSVMARVVDLTSRDEYKTLAEWEGTKIVGGDNRDQFSGELLVKGPSVFKEYWRNPEATQKDFTSDGWFITGDTVEVVNGSFKIMGRKSVDIIKSGGYKLSALEIEAQLLRLDEIKEVSVLALPDATWGQKVAAMIVWNDKELSLNELRDLAKTRLPGYACPSVIKTINELPRNHLGKVNKAELLKLFD